MNTAHANAGTIREVNRAFERGSLDDFLSLCTPAVRWTMLGMGTWDGAETIRREWHRMMGSQGGNLPRISVDQVFADDTGGMADGVVRTDRTDGSEMTTFYCDVYRFEDGKVAELKSYCIDEKPRAAEQATAATEAL